MNLDVIGDIILLCGIILGGILLIVVNVNYMPDEECKGEKDENR